VTALRPEAVALNAHLGLQAGLHFQRTGRSAGHAHMAPNLLGERVLGPGTDLFANELLSHPQAVSDAWLDHRAPISQHQHGCVRFATNGHWLHGCAELHEQHGLHAAAQQAYAHIFEVLATHHCPYLLRLWNYMARINADEAGLERYRHFNAGRHQAFLNAQRSTLEGAPAACGLGTVDGPLRVYFLAGPQPPLTVENPRQVSAYRYPACYGMHAPSFSRAALVGVGGGHQALFISGTASIVGHATVHPNDVRRQTEESLLNLETVRQLAAQQAKTSARQAAPFAAADLVCTIYLRHSHHLEPVREAVASYLGAQSPAARTALYVQADICRADLLVEIEAHGFEAPGFTPPENTE
jgi:chorismate lyase / 3-hydroxybenzoate synthase